MSIPFQLCFRTCHKEGPENQVGLKLNGTHQLLVYDDDVNLFRDNIDTTKKTQKLLMLVRRLV
jgi:hypothetical protein